MLQTNYAEQFALISNRGLLRMQAYIELFPLSPIWYVLHKTTRFFAIYFLNTINKNINKYVWKKVWNSGSILGGKSKIVILSKIIFYCRG